MRKVSITVKKRILFFAVFLFLSQIILLSRLFVLQCFEADKYRKVIYDQQTRDRLIAPIRGKITDRSMTALAANENAASVSVIYSQVKDREATAKALSEVLSLNYENVLKKVNTRVALTRIKTKVDAETAERVRNLGLSGVVVDEDVKRVYPYGSLCSQVIGFVGKDNQGIIGLEAKYDSVLAGRQGKILTETDVWGKELSNSKQERIPPENGLTLVTSIDVNLQQFAEQTIEKTIEYKQAKRGAIILMNPKNGEIYALASKPDFDLNKPFELDADNAAALSEKEKSDALNGRWRNFSINDTYEPGSTFKVITSAIGLETGAVKPNDTFNCGGGREVGGRFIKCWRSPRSHGSETFVQGVQNSCNPVFMDVAAKIGAKTFYEYLDKFGFNEKTGIDLPGEAKGIFHKLEKVGPVELATMSFGQSFQITPFQLLRAESSVINGGHLITPHFAVKTVDENGNTVTEFEYENDKMTISKETSDTMRGILESVVSEGTGNKTYIPGCRIGGKTATSEKLPRRSGKYIASFMAFAPAEDPCVIALVLIDEPQGVYYGGQVAGPVMREILSNALPYLGVKTELNEKEQSLDEVKTVTVGDYVGMKVLDAKTDIEKSGLICEISGSGDEVTAQFPPSGEVVNYKSKIVIYTTIN